MRKLTIILLVIATIQLYAEKQIELTPIVLPYDSLNIDEVYGYGATIIARSGNTIYNSTDDGASWDIALESDSKLNQLYSKDPHTVFAIGDSGLVYRTFDYGATWVDVSIDTDLELRAMAAGDYSEYMIITPKNFTFRMKELGSEYYSVETKTDIELFNITSMDNKYFFGGGARYESESFGPNDYDDILIPVYQYENGRIRTFVADHKYGLLDTYRYRIDTLDVFGSEDQLFISAVFNSSRDYNVGGLSTLGRQFLNLFIDNMYGVKFDNDRIIQVYEEDSTLTYFTREGKLQLINPFIYNSYRYEATESFLLDAVPINHVHKISSKDFYIASNNSTIYRAKLAEIPTSVEMESNNSILLYNNVIELINNTELIFITDYLGKQKELIKVGTNKYILERGLNFVTFSDKGNNIRTVKVMVIE